MASSENSATATCPEGKYAIAGGGNAGSLGWLYLNQPQGNNAWIVAADGNGTTTVTAFVICASLTEPPVLPTAVSKADALR
jgi:hypothetical protein